MIDHRLHDVLQSFFSFWYIIGIPPSGPLLALTLLIISPADDPNGPSGILGGCTGMAVRFLRCLLLDCDCDTVSAFNCRSMEAGMRRWSGGAGSGGVVGGGYIWKP
uniref:Uncharacterized protein n=1 Tax=Anopheles culicifacies TaxID=139723 RepID=A0A182MBD7_9DIPT